jgi:hypothetical protein
MNTFVGFRLFSEVKRFTQMDCNSREKALEPEIQTSYQQLKAKAPACLRLLLWPEEDEKQMRLVNKLFDSPLRALKCEVVCFNSQNNDDHDVCISASVDLERATTSISFSSGDSGLKLGGSAAVGEVKVEVERNSVEAEASR